MTFNPCTCSDQDWAARLATFDAMLAVHATNNEARVAAGHRHADNLRKAMGYRSDHADLAIGLEF